MWQIWTQVPRNTQQAPSPPSHHTSPILFRRTLLTQAICPWTCLCVLSVKFWRAHLGACTTVGWDDFGLNCNTSPDALALDILWLADSATRWEQMLFFWAVGYFLNRTPSDMTERLKHSPFNLVSHIWAVNWNHVYFRWYKCHSVSRRGHRDAVVTRDLVCMLPRARAHHRQHRTQEPRLGKE